MQKTNVHASEKHARSMLLALPGMCLGLGFALFSSTASYGADKADKKDCLELTTTTETSGCLSQEFKRHDQRLNAVYQKLMGVLRPEGQKDLKAAQTAWIAYRDANCQLAGAQHEGGTQALVDTDICRSKMTAQRADELQQLMKEIEEPK